MRCRRAAATTGLQWQRVCPPFSWPPFEAAYYFFSEFTVRASTPLLQLLVLVSRASWQLAEAQPAVHRCRRRAAAVAGSRPTGL